jgi:hypothetical protein
MGQGRGLQQAASRLKLPDELFVPRELVVLVLDVNDM